MYRIKRSNLNVTSVDVPEGTFSASEIVQKNFKVINTTAYFIMPNSIVALSLPTMNFTSTSKNINISQI